MTKKVARILGIKLALDPNFCVRSWYWTVPCPWSRDWKCAVVQVDRPVGSYQRKWRPKNQKYEHESDFNDRDRCLAMTCTVFCQRCNSHTVTKRRRSDGSCDSGLSARRSATARPPPSVVHRWGLPFGEMTHRTITSRSCENLGGGPSSSRS